MELIIDEAGQLWWPPFFSLRHHLFISDLNVDIAGVAIQLGYVHIKRTPRALFVAMRPELCKQPTLVALCDMMFRHQTDRYVLKMPGDLSSKICANPEIALRVLRNAAADSMMHRQTRIVSEEISINDVPLYVEAVELWRRWGGQSTLADLELFLAAKRAHRWSIWQRCRLTGDYQLVSMNDGFTMGDRITKRIKRSLAHRLPDRTYGEWIAAQFRRTTLEGTPRSERVTGIILWPHSGERHYQFSRLHLPFQLPDRSDVVLSVGVDAAVASSN